MRQRCQIYPLCFVGQYGQWMGEAVHTRQTNGKIKYSFTFTRIPDGEAEDAIDQKRYLPSEPCLDSEYTAFIAGIENIQPIKGKDINYPTVLTPMISGERKVWLKKQIGDSKRIDMLADFEDVIEHADDSIGAINWKAKVYGLTGAQTIKS